jgi:hypothetical protein
VFICTFNSGGGAGFQVGESHFALKLQFLHIVGQVMVMMYRTLCCLSLQIYHPILLQLMPSSSMYVTLYLCVYICVSVCLSMYLSIYVSIYLSIYVHMYLPDPFAQYVPLVSIVTLQEPGC